MNGQESECPKWWVLIVSHYHVFCHLLLFIPRAKVECYGGEKRVSPLDNTQSLAMAISSILVAYVLENSKYLWAKKNVLLQGHAVEQRSHAFGSFDKIVTITVQHYWRRSVVRLSCINRNRRQNRENGLWEVKYRWWKRIRDRRQSKIASKYYLGSI